jgi:prevent-host-death family protein
MTATYTVSEARAKLPELLDLVEKGEDVTITRHGKAAAIFVNVERWHRRRDLDIFREADRLAKSLEAARSQPMPDPIPSMDAEAMIREIRNGREAR